MISKTEFSLSASHSSTWTWGKTEAFEKTYTASFSVQAAPKEAIRAISTVTKGEIEVPYKITFASKSTGTKATTEGVWRGVSHWEIRHTTESVGVTAGKKKK